MRVALRSGGFHIGIGRWQDGPGEAVCPITAAAITIGVWRNGHCADGGPDWGTQDQPSETVMEFAVCFDLAADELGLDRAVTTVRSALGECPEAPACRDAA
jgi:hypothetical protein